MPSNTCFSFHSMAIVAHILTCHVLVNGFADSAFIIRDAGRSTHFDSIRRTTSESKSNCRFTRHSALGIYTKPSDSYLSPFYRQPEIDAGLRYSSNDWLVNFLSIPNSFVLRRIIFHLSANTVISAAVVYLFHETDFLVPIPLIAHTILGSFLGLLLVFRTNSAYARFWEGRGIWSKTMAKCSQLAINTMIYIHPCAPKSSEKLVELLAAFPDALAYRCLSGSIPLEEHVDKLVNMQSYPLLDGDAGDPGTILCMKMHKAIMEVENESPASATNYLEALHLSEISHGIDSLITCLADCGKIVETPVPLSYSRHTSRFLTLWSGTLPFALVEKLDDFTVPVVAIICWCLFGIEEIGHLIEQPFIPSNTSMEKLECGGKDIPIARKAVSSLAYDTGLPVCSLASGCREEVHKIASIYKSQDNEIYTHHGRVDARNDTRTIESGHLNRKKITLQN